MKYLEFLGIPGSGKTTAAKTATTILEQQGKTVLHRWNAKQRLIKIWLRQQSGVFCHLIAWLSGFTTYPGALLWSKERYWLLMHFLQQQPDLLQQVIVSAETTETLPSQYRDMLSAEKLIRWFCDVACIYQAGQEWLQPADVLMLEEGWCQQAYYLIVAFREQNIDASNIERYVELLPKPDGVVFLLADPEECERRLNTRATGIPSSILSSMTASERIALLEERLKTYRVVVDTLKKKNVPVIQLETQDKDDAGQILTDYLAHF